MRTTWILILAALAVCAISARELDAQTTAYLAASRPIPPEMTSRYAHLHPRLQPSANSWVQGQARVELGRSAPDVSALQSAVSGRFGKAGLSTGDIEAIVFIVLMEAANNTDNDLKAQMGAMQALNAAKASARNLMDQLNQEIASLAAMKSGATCQSPFCRSLAHQLATIARQTESASAAAKMGRVVGAPVHASVSNSHTTSAGELWNASALAATAPLTYAHLHEIQTQLGSSLKSLDDQSDMQSLELQMTMDRRSKLLDTLSNVMKTIADANDAVIGNLK
jgi:hypothetical protein